jgi:hypothetical protein
MPKGHYDHQNAKLIEPGTAYGDWVVTGRSDKTNPSGQVFWECRCVCGRERDVSGYSLRSGKSRGCGCTAAKQFGASLVKHGLSDTVEHRIWIAMRSRCSNPNTTKWNLYGERGITVDPRWDQFETFLADMGPRPSPRHSIERRDGSKGYSPGNCYWATPQQQNRNTSRNHFLTYQGETLTVAEWAERRGMTYGSLSNRVADGWSVEDALTIPVGRAAARAAHRRARVGA